VTILYGMGEVAVQWTRWHGYELGVSAHVGSRRRKRRIGLPIGFAAAEIVENFP